VLEKLLAFHLLREGRHHGRVDFSLTPPIRYLHPNQVSGLFLCSEPRREFEESDVQSQTGILIHLRF
jgi:hypothetical protein